MHLASSLWQWHKISTMAGQEASMCSTKSTCEIHVAQRCLPVIANGVITYAPDSVQNYSLGTTATYSCNAGFSLDLSAGSETRTCVNDGNDDAEGIFDLQAPTCVRKSTGNILYNYSSNEVQYSLKLWKTFTRKTGQSHVSCRLVIYAESLSLYKTPAVKELRI